MPITPFTALTCPLDGDSLYQEGASWHCATGHSFDVAKQGYINLLPVQKKRSRDPGDSKEMVAARQRFLNAGFYQPIANAVNKMILADMDDASTLSCLDAGCGEGYYLRQLAEAIPERQVGELAGLDISKWAVLSAAKQQKAPRWVVGSNANIPVLSQSLDRLLCMFGFPVYGEFARVLKVGGELIQVDTGPDHLRELREIIYPQLKPENDKKIEAPEGFSRLSEETVSYPLNLSSHEQIADLLAMTPHLYRASSDGRAKAEALTELAITVDVRMVRYERVS